jgi:hypothetical protein
VKYVKKNLENLSLYRRKNYHEPLRSLFIANFKNVSRTCDNPVYIYIYIHTYIHTYMVIHKSVKHFKNSQQIHF